MYIRSVITHNDVYSDVNANVNADAHATFVNSQNKPIPKCI